MIKIYLLFIVLFTLLTGLTAMSFGIIKSNDDIISSVYADQPYPMDKSLIVVKQKTFGFFSQDYVCSCNKSQAEAIENIYEITEKEILVDGMSKSVLYANDKPLTKAIIEERLNARLGNCHKFHIKGIIALMLSLFSPVLIS